VTQRVGITGLPPALTVSRSPRATALDELQMHDWWRQALAETGEDVTAACVSILRERSDDPLLVLACLELDRLARGAR